MAITTKYPFGQSATIGGVTMILVQSLPTASSSTMGDIYLVPRSGSDIKDMYITTVSGSSYSWTPIGSTEIDLSDVPYIRNGSNGSDLEIADEQDNVLVRFSNGHIKTKGFDSENLITIDGNRIKVN